MQHRSRPRTAILVHVYHLDIWQRIATRLQALEGQWDLYITLSQAIADQHGKALRQSFPQAQLYIYPNQGMDILPYLRVLPTLIERKYTQVLKLHTKRGTAGFGQHWGEALFDALIGHPKAVKHAEEMFDKHPALGLLGPAAFFLSGKKLMLENRSHLETLSAALLDQPLPEDDWGFFAGTMFWSQPCLWAGLSQWATQHSCAFGADYAQDGQWPHALERAFGLLPKQQNVPVALLHRRNEEQLPYVQVIESQNAVINQAGSYTLTQQITTLDADKALLEAAGLLDTVGYRRYLHKRGWSQHSLQAIDLLTHYLLIGQFSGARHYAKAWALRCQNQRINWEGLANKKRQPGLVSIVMPVFNQLALTQQAVQAVAQHTPATRYELLLVDNGSEPETRTGLVALQERYAQVKVVTLERNLFFALGSNLGFAEGKGEFTVFLNNDTTVNANWLPPLIDALRHQQVYAAQPQLLYPDGTLQCMGVVFSNRSVLGYPIYSGMPPGECQAEKPRCFQAITAACMAIRSELFARMQGFDAIYINGQEDVDLCLRLYQETDLPAAYVPQSVVVHHESKTQGRGKYIDQNRQVFVQRWQGITRADDMGYYARDGFKVSGWQQEKGKRPNVIRNYKPELYKEPAGTKMSKKKTSALKLANEAFRNKDYILAEEKYKEVLSSTPELKNAISFNLDHVASKREGVRLTRKIKVWDKCHGTAFFDAAYYLEENPDVRAAGINPEHHYWQQGEREGRRPTADFDPVFYLKINSDVRKAGISPFVHYRDTGKKEGRLGCSPIECSERGVSKRLKPLLFVGHDGILAGSEIVLLEIIRWFYEHTQRRIKLLLLAPGPVADRYAKYSDLYVLPKGEVDDPKQLKGFLNEEFEFVYLNTVVSGKIFHHLDEHGIQLQGEVLAHIHEMEKVLETFPEAMQALLEKTKHWISASPASSETLLNKYKIQQDALTTVPAFINPVARKAAANNELQVKARQQLGLKEKSFVVAGCGTIYWRKGTDLFIEVARKLKEKTNQPIEFVWIGAGPDRKELERELTREEQQWIKFAGNRNNANELLAAADVFFMSSREDPFPLVVLESAQHGVPTVCFEPATGITAFIEKDAGIAVPAVSTDLAAEAFYTLLVNPQERERLGNTARQKLFANYTTERQNLKIFRAVQEATDYRPSVSVIVPFYNHENFIEERFDSILSQSIKDIEVIAMDDCSTDNTLEKVHGYLRDGRITVVENEENSGSPFKQWEKGISLASGDIVWIAEGDDSCSDNFLSELLEKFDDPLVNIAFAGVEMIDEFGDVKPGVFKPYFDMASPGKFECGYIKTGVDEVSEHFGAYQTLVNASGLLIRKSSFGVNLETARSHKMCGDWLIYLECMKRGKIVFCPEATNYFRRHSNSQVVKIEGSEQYFQERYEITQYIVDNFPIGKKQLVKAFQAIDYEWDRFRHKHPEKSLQDFYDKAHLLEALNKKKRHVLPSLLVVVSDLSPGGGQLFSIRLANAWYRLGGSIVLVNVGKHPEHPEVARKVAQGVPIFNAIDINLAEVTQIFDVDVIHSSIWWSDKYVHENYSSLPEKVRWVVSTHGCYEALLHSPALDRNFRPYFQGMLHEVDHWVYTAEKNLQVFDELGFPARLAKILNGYEPEQPEPLDKTALGIRADACVLCLASRATEDKGWFVAVDAVKRLNDKGHRIDLLLIGEGPAADHIRAQYQPEYIHLIGQVSNLQDYIAISDIGILPSMFISESMPLVLIEFMAQGKAMVATDIGEIRNMTQDTEGSSARVIGLNDGKVSAAQLAEQLEEVYQSSSELRELEIHSRRRFQYFEMNNMLSGYRKIYDEVLI